MSRELDHLMPLWKPNDVSSFYLEQFKFLITKKYNVHLLEYEDLYEWSILNSELFWTEIWNFVGIRSSSLPNKTVETLERMYPPPKWFLGSKLNYAENILEPYGASPDANKRIAIIQANEEGIERKITFAQLKDLTKVIAAAMVHVGVKVGDAVAAYASNRYEVIAFMLAATSLGAVYTASSPDFGPEAVHSRFYQAKNLKLLLSMQTVRYNGKSYDHTEKLIELMGLLNNASLKVVFLDDVSDVNRKKIANPCYSWAQFQQLGATQRPLTFEQLDFDHPLFILYSSGSTGAPKCIIHSAGGALIQHKKEHMIHGNVSVGDLFLQISTIAWMMWHWMISVLSLGATLICYDGSPFMPSSKYLWTMMNDLNVTHFSTSAKYLQILQEKGYEPCKDYPLSSLRHIFSTGSPLHPHSFAFVYNSIKTDVHLASITGGTDIISLFAGGNPSGRVYAGQIQCRCLGMAVQSWDEHNQNGMARAGDLVCVKPFPCMPIYFGNDPDGKKYYSAYFDKYKDPLTKKPVWYHGDYIYIHSQSKGIVMLGRSDGTLNPAGVRFGSAEIYNAIASFVEISDSLVIGQSQPESDDERVILFVKLGGSETLTEELKNQIIGKIRYELSPRHVPGLILSVPAIPYTMNGKKAEVIVKKILGGHSNNIKDLSTGLENPDSLNVYEELRKKYSPVS